MSWLLLRLVISMDGLIMKFDVIITFIIQQYTKIWNKRFGPCIRFPHITPQFIHLIRSIAIVLNTHAVKYVYLFVTTKLSCRHVSFTLTDCILLSLPCTGNCKIDTVRWDRMTTGFQFLGLLYKTCRYYGTWHALDATGDNCVILCSCGYVMRMVG